MAGLSPGGLASLVFSPDFEREQGGAVVVRLVAKNRPARLRASLAVVVRLVAKNRPGVLLIRAKLGSRAKNRPGVLLIRCLSGQFGPAPCSAILVTSRTVCEISHPKQPPRDREAAKAKARNAKRFGRG